MTVREYINQKLDAFGVSDATLLELAVGGLDYDADYNEETAEIVGKALCSVIEEIAFIPHKKSINESGFSISWDYSGIAKYYLWLCRKWGVTPNEDTLAMMDMSTITDRSDLW